MCALTLTPVDAVAEAVALAPLVDDPPVRAARPRPRARPQEVGAVLEVEQGVAGRGPVASAVAAR